MTREEAIEILKQFKKCLADVVFDEKGSEAWQMAIQALSQEPCDDAISRQAVLEIVKDMRGLARNDVLADAIKRIEKLSSVRPQEQTGHWIEHPEIETSTPEYLMFYECSECEDKQCFYKTDIHKKRFCINCGAKMESEDKE